MNILHYFLGFPPFHSGGLMIYARDLAKEQLRQGYKVKMLMPGTYNENESISYIKYFKTIDGLPVFQIINGLPFSYIGIKDPQKFMHEVMNNNYKEFLLENGIDIVHVHSLMGLPKEFIESVKDLNIKSFYTSHDYFGICPQIHLFNYNYEHCTNYRNGFECVKCNFDINEDDVIKRRNKYFSSKYQLIYGIYSIPFVRNIYRFIKKLIKCRNNNAASLNFSEKVIINNYRETADDKNKSFLYKKLRNYNIDILNKIDVFIFNSSVTMKEYGKYIDLDSKSFYIEPVTHNNIRDNRNSRSNLTENKNIVHFTFMGYLDKKKGFFDLTEVLETIRMKYTNWDLSIYGDYSTINTNKYDPEYFFFKGRYIYDDLPEMFEKTDILIIPSKCKETFGFIGLEAMSYGVPVMASNNVGYSDLIKMGSTGIIYNDNVYNQDLYECLCEIIRKPDLTNVFRDALKNVKFEHSLEEHVKTLLVIYRSSLTQGEI